MDAFTERLLKKAWLDGIKAREEGEPQQNCPFLTDPFIAEWIRGWNLASTMLHKEVSYV